MAQTSQSKKIGVGSTFFENIFQSAVWPVDRWQSSVLDICFYHEDSKQYLHIAINVDFTSLLTLKISKGIQFFYFEKN